MAVCHDLACAFSPYDTTANAGGISKLGQLDFHHHPQRFGFACTLFPCCLLSCVPERAGASQTAGQILVHQRDCLLLLLAGKNYAERGEIGKIAETKIGEIAETKWFVTKEERTERSQRRKMRDRSDRRDE
ncbi:hypothetical protein Syun_028875 [Stephania yunnanensis]|uniref:Uncharacterized protein n=1 Tax=Stephania yunnanensis TaxID=152371 RepID=A0AAP0E4L3_9MAGN